MKKILITGGCGFIGSHLVEYMTLKGYEVTVFDRYNINNHWGWLEHSEYKKDIEVILGDIRDFDSVFNASKGCNNILHLAALIGIPYSYISPLAYIRTNIEGTYNILECARKRSFENIIVTSTSEVYGSGLKLPMKEDHRIIGQSPYSASKISADQLSISYHRSFDMPIKIIRPFNTYGPRQSARAIIPTIFTQAYDSNYIKIGNNNTTRDFTYVLDLCNAYEKLLKCRKNNAYGNIYNIGNNMEISVKDLIYQIKNITGKNKKIISDSKRVRKPSSEVQRLRCDYSAFKKLTKWEPKYSINSGLKKFNNWFLEHRNVYKSNQYNI